MSNPSSPTLFISPQVATPNLSVITNEISVTPISSVVQPIAAINDPIVTPIASVVQPIATINDPIVTPIASVVRPIATINDPTMILSAPVVQPIATINDPTMILSAPVVQPIATINDPTMILSAPAIEINGLEETSAVPVVKRGKTRKRTERTGKPKRNIDHQVYVVHSQAPLSVVIDEINRHIPIELKSQADLIGPCRIVFSRREETDRAICVFDRRIFAEMKRQGLTANRMWADFKVVPFRLREALMPQRGQRHLFVILPDQLTITNIKKQLENELKILSNFGIVKPNTYQILIPFKSRDSDDHVGKCYIVWNNRTANEDRTVNEDRTANEDIAMTKIILNDSRWMDSEGYSLEGNQGLRRCFWSRIANPKNIKMSPADRSYTHNHREQRQNKIQRHDYQTKKHHSRKHGDRQRPNTSPKHDRIVNHKKQSSSFDFVISEVPQIIPNMVQPVYEPLSVISQPIPVRGHVPLAVQNIQPNVITLQPVNTVQVSHMIDINQPIFLSQGNPEVVSVNTAKLPRKTIS